MYWSGPEAVAFGCREQVCSYDVLIGEKLDAIAKSVICIIRDFTAWTEMCIPCAQGGSL